MPRWEITIRAVVDAEDPVEAMSKLALENAKATIKRVTIRAYEDAVLEDLD